VVSVAAAAVTTVAIVTTRTDTNIVFRFFKKPWHCRGFLLVRPSFDRSPQSGITE
jgi:hypothetical protein